MWFVCFVVCFVVVGCLFLRATSGFSLRFWLEEKEAASSQLSLHQLHKVEQCKKKVRQITYHRLLLRYQKGSF